MDSTIIFQCNECRTYIGNSSFITHKDHVEKIICFKALSNIAISEDLTTISTGDKAGSSFNDVFCEGCGAKLGEYFTSTPSTLDHLRDRFSLEAFKLSSTILDAPSVKANSSTKEEKSEEQERALEDALARLIKCESLLLHFDDRMRSVEAFCSMFIANHRNAAGGAGGKDKKRRRGDYEDEEEGEDDDEEFVENQLQFTMRQKRRTSSSSSPHTPSSSIPNQPYEMIKHFTSSQFK
jgi:hypothetical protein